MPLIPTFNPFFFVKDHVKSVHGQVCARLLLHLACKRNRTIPDISRFTHGLCVTGNLLFCIP